MGKRASNSVDSGGFSRYKPAQEGGKGSRSYSRCCVKDGK